MVLEGIPGRKEWMRWRNRELQSASGVTFVGGPRLQRVPGGKRKNLELENQIKKTQQIIKKEDSDKRKRAATGPND